MRPLQILILLLALTALSGAKTRPLTLEPGTYTPVEEASHEGLQRLDYQPGMVRITTPKQTLEVPILQDLPPLHPRGFGIWLLPQNPNGDPREATYLAMLYRVSPYPGVARFEYFDTFERDERAALAHARKHQQAADADPDGRAGPFGSQTAHERWAALPALPVDDRAALMNLLKGVVARMGPDFGTESGIHWLEQKGFNPASMDKAEKFCDEHAQDADVRHLRSDIVRRAKQMHQL